MVGGPGRFQRAHTSALLEKPSYLLFPEIQLDGDDELVRDTRKQNKLRAFDCAMQKPRLLGRNTRVVGAVQHQRRALNGTAVVFGVEREAVESPTDTTPEQEYFGKGRWGKPHRHEAVLHCVEKHVESRLENDAIRLDALGCDGTKNSSAAHREAVEYNPTVRPSSLNIVDRRSNVVRFQISQRRTGARRPTRTIEIDKECGKAEFVERVRHREKDRLACGVSVEQQNRQVLSSAGHIPGFDGLITHREAMGFKR